MMNELDKNIKVSVVCLTFNHAPYIRQCLDGFVHQQTSFPFEVIIHDDASTDGTREIIEEYSARYPHIIKPVFEKENQYSRHGDFNVIIKDCIRRCSGPYIGFCEGDDYWTDPLKLQKQIDFLDANPEYGMCFTDFDIKNEASGRYTKDIFKNHIKGFRTFFSSPEEFILDQAYVCPPSWIFRKELFPDNTLGSSDSSFFYFAHFLCTTRVKYLDFSSAVYRIISESASHSSNFDKLYRRMQNLLQTKLRIIDHYHLNPDYKRLCIENYYRLNLVDLVINRKDEDIRKAKKILRNKSRREQILLKVYDMHLNSLLPIVRKILPSRL